jgi:hypothetical protein
MEKVLAELIWRKIRGDAEFRVVHDKPFEYDGQRRAVEAGTI